MCLRSGNNVWTLQHRIAMKAWDSSLRFRERNGCAFFRRVFRKDTPLRCISHYFLGSQTAVILGRIHVLWAVATSQK